MFDSVILYVLSFSDFVIRDRSFEVYASNLNLLMSLQASRSNSEGISDILIPSFNQMFGNIVGVFKVISIAISALEEGEVDTVRIVKSFDPQITLLLIMELQ
uniref:Uncharacterized protein n=1 Tax=Lactuca sativa TaxID=4236 RepID=A0A9R1W5N1_LACSA|nr:hypothetical protein LSAT_V11C300143040 [Lactuca sativa]